MSILKKHLFLILLLVYIFAFVIFWGKLWLDLEKKPQASGQSSVPVLSTSQLNKITTQLDMREKLDYGQKIDLEKINFGKIEPFSP